MMSPNASAYDEQLNCDHQLHLSLNSMKLLVQFTSLYSDSTATSYHQVNYFANHAILKATSAKIVKTIVVSEIATGFATNCYFC